MVYVDVKSISGHSGLALSLVDLSIAHWSCWHL